MKGIDDGMSPKVVGRATVEPDAAGVLQAISRIGYQIQDALADLIDNSIDAHAGKVLVRFFRNGDRLTSVAIVDDGEAMSARVLDEAMRFGSQTKKKANELGKYGMGLKSASLNHASTLVVISKRAGEINGRRWTSESIQDGWKLEQLDPDGTAHLFERDWGPVNPASSGTLVLWERIHRFETAGNAGRTFAALSKTINKHLGLVFHRFIQDDRLEIYLDLQDQSGETGMQIQVEALNPFPKKSGGKGYPAEFHTELGVYGDLSLRAHLWPPNMPDIGYKLGGKVAQRQGFYFFRNDRLIQAGGWNGWRDDAEPHSSLARVEVNLPSSFDDAFAISVQKDGVDAPPGFVPALEAARSGHSTLADYMRDAVDLYRSDEPGTRGVVPVVNKGLRVGLRKQIEGLVVGEDPVKERMGVEIIWSPDLATEEVFRIDAGDATIQINDKYRSIVLAGDAASIGDAPIFKTLLFVLLKEDVLKNRVTKQLQQRHNLLNSLLLAAIKDAQ